MITVNNADSALKSFYLDAVAEALNVKVNPFLAKIQQSTANVVGKDVKKVVRSAISGGIGAGTEMGNLPKAGGSEYLTFVSELKNLYGTIEISDKALRASANNEGAFVNLLNEEMDSLIKGATLNFGRMLYGDGTGYLCKVTSIDGYEATLESVKGIVEGMLLDFTDSMHREIDGCNGLKVVGVDRANKKVIVNSAGFPDNVVGGAVYFHASKGYEITGLGALFSDCEIYGQERDVSSILQPYMDTDVGDIDEETIQKAIDTIEENSGSKINFIVCSWGVRRALVKYYREHALSLPSMEIEGGFTAISFNGIPVVADRFCPDGTMYLLNTDDFAIHQLCDWKWLEGEDGKILKQVPGKPVYTATLVKYAELMCERPYGQGMLSGITEA